MCGFCNVGVGVCECFDNFVGVIIIIKIIIIIIHQLQSCYIIKNLLYKTTRKNRFS